MNIREKSNYADVSRARIYPECQYTPKKDEKVYSCNPEAVHRERKGFRITSLKKVLSCPTDLFTASTIWQPMNEEKYLDVFEKLESEEKIVCVGSINHKNEVVISEKGKVWLKRMADTFEWSTNY